LSLLSIAPLLTGLAGWSPIRFLLLELPYPQQMFIGQGISLWVSSSQDPVDAIVFGHPEAGTSAWAVAVCAWSALSGLGVSLLAISSKVAGVTPTTRFCDLTHANLTLSNSDKNIL